MADNDTKVQVNDTGPTFFSGWRPLLGYVSIVALGLNLIVFPAFQVLCAFFGKSISVPSINLGPLVTLITGVLGLGGLRTFEKWTGVHGNH